MVLPLYQTSIAKPFLAQNAACAIYEYEVRNGNSFKISVPKRHGTHAIQIFFVKLFEEQFWIEYSKPYRERGFSCSFAFHDCFGIIEVLTFPLVF